MALHGVYCRSCVLWANEIESGEMGETFSTQVTYGIWSKTLEERDDLKYLGVVECAILKYVFKKWDEGLYIEFI